ncbi:MAG TPA: quinol:electron acceptor oxidoreductase subunit ActD [Verrucomicrobiae bacterium]|nr:quinol:electron acceptor oxidoreductase subunit ActD [Verrucomicrobiae bacterium]
MSLPYGEINDVVLDATDPPRRRIYYAVLGGLALIIGWALLMWIYQVRFGMGVAGISHPVNWGVYIANFVFWVGIAHSGTLISAILFLVRARWRDAVSRSAEAMTVFAVMTAGLFPLIHLGRLWVVYFILPYPSQRRLWPNFQSPLVWDVVAVSTYFTVSAVFFYVGLIPDLAAARDRAEAKLGESHWRSRLYRALSLGWCGSLNQWRHYGRSYLFFSALATPLVISVHSIVSWDFAMSLLPGWHTTIFAPYFVAGAIHSGLAMVLTLLIPMRRILKLESVIRRDHLDAVAKTIIVTTLIVGYSYVVEALIPWYSGNTFEMQFAWWRAFGERAWAYWLLFPLNVLFPLLFLSRRLRESSTVLLLVSVGINIGMWLERFMIVTFSTGHDFLPHNWGSYAPTFVEISITAGSFAWFMLLFLSFSKVFPTVAMADVKEERAREETGEEHNEEAVAVPHPPAEGAGVVAVFRDAASAEEGLRRLLAEGFLGVEMYSPVKPEGALAAAGYGKSPVRFWTLAGALAGVTAGFSLAAGSALVNRLIVGGKPPVALIPYCVIGFEAMVLLGTLGNLSGLLFHTGLLRRRRMPGYDRSFSRDRFGLVISCGAEERMRVDRLLDPLQPEVIRPLRKEAP